MENKEARKQNRRNDTETVASRCAGNPDVAPLKTGCDSKNCTTPPPPDIAAWEAETDESYYCYDCGQCPVCGHHPDCRQADDYEEA